MKNSNYIINGVLIIAVLVLFILQFTGKKGVAKQLESIGVFSDSTHSHLPIAYIRTDSLLSHYKFFLDLNDASIKKIEDKKLIINKRQDQLQKEVNDYYQKAQMNAFITQERAQQEQNRLSGLKQDLDNYIAQANQEMQMDQAKLQQQLTDTIISALKIFNTPKKYEMILSNAGTDNILYADDSYDITNEVTDFLNARYVPAK